MSDTVIIKTVGWGTAASNIGPMGNTLHIIVHEWHSMHDGEIDVTVDPLESNTMDMDGKMSSDKIQTTQTIHATWMPSGSNRLTAPNVRVGERVEVLEESDTGNYYWRPAGLDEKHRRLETIIWGISATPNEGDDPYDPENRYWIEFSSHSKKIVLTTSAKNGEKARFNITVDGGEGLFNLMDHKGNFATLNSVEDNWKVATTQGSFIEIDKVDINMVAVDNMVAKIGNNMSVDAGNNIAVSAGSNMSISASNDMSLSSTTMTASGTDSVVVKGGGATMTWAGGGIKWTGAFFTGN